MPFSKVRSVSILFVALLASGCNTFNGDQATPESETMLMPVLADMVRNEDQDRKILRIVDLRSPQIEELRQHCGPKYQIVSAYDSDNRQDDGVKNRSEGTVHIRAEIVRVNGIWAEARAAYGHKNSDGSGSFASFRYKLRYKNSEWRIISCEFVAAS